MKFYNDLRLMQSVNIFTDVSTTMVKPKNSDNAIIVNSLGMLVTYNSLIPCQTIRILVDEHNVFGELKAIELAVMWCISHANPNFPYYYNIFTDSQTSVASINGYLSNYFVNKTKSAFNLLKNTHTHKDQYKTNFENVSKIIAYLIVTQRLPIRIIYTPAHVDLEKYNKDKTLIKAINKFKNLNKYFHFDINQNEMYMILSGNHAIDYLSRAYLLNNLNYIKQDIDRTSYYIQYGIRRDIPLVWPYSFYDKEDFFIAGYAAKFPHLQYDEIVPVPAFAVPPLQLNEK